MESLTRELSGVVEKGINVVVGGDFNESLYSPEGMSEMLGNIGLVNVFEYRQNSTLLPRTYSRGSKAVDHIWVTPYLLDHLTYAAIAPFGYMYESDHRGLFIDIDDTMLFEPEDVKLVYHDFRRLKSNVPKRAKRYMRIVDSDWKIHKITEKYFQLVELCAVSTDKKQIESDANELDNLITKTLIRAETKCTMMSSHHLDVWTPELIQAMKNKRHWRTKSTQAQKLPLKIGIVASLSKYQEVHKKFKEAEKEYNSLCKEARDARSVFLQERAKYAAQLKNTIAEKEIKSIIEVEQKRAQPNRVNSVLKKKNGGGPNSILIPAETEYPMPHNQDFDPLNIDQIWDRIELHNGEDITNWNRITDQKIVVDMLLRWQQKHFAQATETPFSCVEWKQQLQDKNIQQALLDGTFPIPDDLPMEAQELLQEIRSPTHGIDEIRSYTNFDDFRDYIRHIEEKKSPSPSGRHYGHYKTILNSNAGYLRLIHGLAEIALQNGFVLERWKKL